LGGWRDERALAEAPTTLSSVKKKLASVSIMSDLYPPTTLVGGLFATLVESCRQ